jgi:hypothetical protein
MSASVFGVINCDAAAPSRPCSDTRRPTVSQGPPRRAANVIQPQPRLVGLGSLLLGHLIDQVCY